MRQKRKEEKELFHNKDCEKKEKNSWERMKHTGTEKMASEGKWNLSFGIFFFSSNSLKLMKWGFTGGNIWLRMKYLI